MPSPTAIGAGITTLQFVREAYGVFDLGHDRRGKLSQFAFQPGFDQRPDTLDVDDGRLVQKGKGS